MSGELTVLIIGGYGTFGGRLVDLLAGEPRLTLIVSGRSNATAVAFCRARGDAQANLIPASFDRRGDLAAELSRLRPDVVVDASGPFQAYGREAYRLIEACLAQGADYLDLADGSSFVAGVARYDAGARAAGRFVLSGVSSFPVLTAAVVRRLASGMSRVDAIRGGIAPSPFAGVGLNVIRAIANYAGQATPLRRNGRNAKGYPLTETMRFVIAPPGRVPLRDTLFSLVDVPDLQALTALWPDAKTIWIGAGPVPEMLHRALIALAWLVRLRLVPSIAPLAPIMHFVTGRVRWGEHRGGMFVEVEGLDAGGARECRSWHMLAEGDDGPLIPSMAAEAIVRRVLDQRPPSPGARAALTELEWEDYQRLFARRAIHSGVRVAGRQDEEPLFARVLGELWSELPPEIRAMHSVGRASVACGRATVERGRSLLATLIAAVMRFPRASADTPIEVTFSASEGTETWTRRFGEHSFSSRQFAGRGRSAHLLCEQFGPLTFAMALVWSQGRLSLQLRRWSAFGVPLPLWLCATTEASESVVDGRFSFDIAIGHPFSGLIVRYRGWLAPVPPSVCG